MFEYSEYYQKYNRNCCFMVVSERLTTYGTTINPSLGLQFASPDVTDNATIKNGLSHTRQVYQPIQV